MEDGEEGVGCEVSGGNRWGRTNQDWAKHIRRTRQVGSCPITKWSSGPRARRAGERGAAL